MFNFEEFIREVSDWSYEVHGPGERTTGIVAHITKELGEILQEPHDIVEWADIIILGINGAIRHGATPESLIETLKRKHSVNQLRQWPDYTKFPEDKPLEHIR